MPFICSWKIQNTNQNQSWMSFGAWQRMAYAIPDKDDSTFIITPSHLKFHEPNYEWNLIYIPCLSPRKTRINIYNTSDQRVKKRISPTQRWGQEYDHERKKLKDWLSQKMVRRTIKQWKQSKTAQLKSRNGKHRCIICF